MQNADLDRIVGRERRGGSKRKRPSQGRAGGA
jgi:hypothetical protein